MENASTKEFVVARGYHHSSSSEMMIGEGGLAFSFMGPFRSGLTPVQPFDPHLP